MSSALFVLVLTGMAVTAVMLPVLLLGVARLTLNYAQPPEQRPVRSPWPVARTLYRHLGFYQRWGAWPLAAKLTFVLNGFGADGSVPALPEEQLLLAAQFSAGTLCLWLGILMSYGEKVWIHDEQRGLLPTPGA